MNTTVKIPLLLGAAVGTHISGTAPPSPPLSESEKLPKGKMGFTDRVLSMLIRVGVPKFNKYFYWLSTSVEILAIIAARYPVLFTVFAKSNGATNPWTSFLIQSGGKVRLNTVQVLGCALCIFGGYLRGRCYRELGHMFTYQLSVRQKHRLVTTGPYAVVRHPSYTGMTMVAFGNLLCVLGPGSWVREIGVMQTTIGRVFVGSWALVRIAIAFLGMKRSSIEDEMMKKQFPDEWVEWSSRVRYKFIPGVI